jgi:signal transduction histidine kinase
LNQLAKPIKVNNSLLKINLLIFSSLFLLVLGYFYWQIDQSRRAFDQHISEHTQLVSQVVAANLNNAQQSRQVIEQVVTSFLSNTARFVAYLDEIQPFSATELEAYVQENGLSGLLIQYNDQPPVMSPSNWYTLSKKSATNKQLIHQEQQQQYVLIWSDTPHQRTIVLGLPAQAIERLQQQMQVPHLLKSLSQLSGIEQLRLELTANISTQPLKTNERQLRVGDNTITIVIEEQILARREEQLWQQFLLFSSLLAVAAIGLSWILQGYQNRYTHKMLQLQLQLAHQREDALLGRAAAAISHEVRNPLNAISIGLQRLQLEDNNLKQEHHALILAMMNAVQRTDGIVIGLQRFAQHLTPKLKLTAIDQQISTIIELYSLPAQQQRVIIANTMEHIVAAIDPDLFSLVMENIIKNAIEAQPDGGYINISLQRCANEILLEVENGTNCDSIDLEQCLAPYFTTKTRGTGLGLAMVNKIILAHAGTVVLDRPDSTSFSVNITLPLKEQL